MMYNFLLFQKREEKGCVIFPNFQSLFPPLDLFLLTFPLCTFLKIYFSLISFSFKLLFSFPYLTSFLLSSVEIPSTNKEAGVQTP